MKSSSRPFQLPQFMPFDRAIDTNRMVLPGNDQTNTGISNRLIMAKNGDERPKIKTIKKSDEKFVCPLCKKGFEYEEILKKHMQFVCSKVLFKKSSRFTDTICSFGVVNVGDFSIMKKTFVHI